jgi:L-lactate dehydrogenase complex protein LldG
VSARDDLLAALRRAAPGEVPLPDLSALGATFDDPASRFADSLVTVGGVCLRVADLEEARRALAELPVLRAARDVVSLVPALAPGSVDPAAIPDPHALEGLDASVLPGVLAVAENGAVWVDGAGLPHAALFVIPEHLVLIVDAGAVVPDMHAAYARLASRPPGYGVFIAGPSKTADIEQALVIGAHGARSCTVLLVGSA